LRHVVVQLARQASALLFVRSDQPTAQLVRRGFRADAVPMLVEEPCDQRGLQDNRGRSPQYGHTMPLPRGRVAKMNLASRRQAARANAPTLHLPPIELRSRKTGGRRFDLARLLSTKDAESNPGYLLAVLEHRNVRAANNVTAEEGVGITENWRVGDGMKPCQSRSLFMHHTRRIDDHQLPEDCGTRWKRGSMLQYVQKWQIIIPRNCNPMCERPHLIADLVAPVFFDGGSPDNNCHIPGVRQHPQDILEGRKIVDRDRNYGVIRGKNGILNSTLIHYRKHHRSCGKELLPMPLDKGGRRRADAHNQVERPFGKEDTEVLDEWALRVFIAGTGNFERMLMEVQRPG
jgi:hypothetical protein